MKDVKQTSESHRREARPGFFLPCLLLFITTQTLSQSFLNGSFEQNSITGNGINLSNQSYGNYMAHSTAFGSLGNMDIIRTDDYCGPAQQGDVFVALTGGGTDAISLYLSAPVLTGNTYRISFYDRLCPPGSEVPHPVQVGLSPVPDDFGSTLYTAPVPEVHWTKRAFTFVAPHDGAYITVRVENGNSFDTWAQIDNFSFECNIQLDLGNDTVFCGVSSVVLNSGITNASYIWQDGSTDPQYEVHQSGTYIVTATSDYCHVADTINLKLFPDCSGDLFIPNAFTPNKDGRNDLFRPLGVVAEWHMEVFNRWGLRLFESSERQVGWDGSYKGMNQPSGTYIYFLRYKTFSGESRTRKGLVTLIR